MKKNILIFWLIIKSLILNAQTIITSSEINWSGLESGLTDTQKINLLSDINGDLFYYLKDNNFLNKNLKNFHFLDFNCDEKLDFIYIGYSGAENISTIIYLQKQKGFFDKIFETTGQLSDFEKLAYTDCFFKIKISSNDSCYDCLGVKNLSTFLLRQGKFEKIENLSYTDNIVIPSFTFKKKFTIIKQGYNLRSTPKIVNKSVKTAEVFSLFGNVTATYKKGTVGYAYAKKQSEDGRIWWFVILKGEQSEKSIFENKSGYYLGWMSNRFLKEIKQRE